MIHSVPSRAGLVQIIERGKRLYTNAQTAHGRIYTHAHARMHIHTNTRTQHTQRTHARTNTAREIIFPPIDFIISFLCPMSKTHAHTHNKKIHAYTNAARERTLPPIDFHHFVLVSNECPNDLLLFFMMSCPV